MKNNDTIARNIFQERIKKGLLGPGSDIFVDEKDKNEEIIADYPLQRYYTGVLFPEQIRVNTLAEKDENELNNETDSDEVDIQNEIVEKIEPNNENYTAKNKGVSGDDELKVPQNTFFPSNIGLTFCIDNKVKALNVEFNFGLYSQIKTGIKIKISKRDFDEFINHNSFPFKEIISYENRYMILKPKLSGKKLRGRSKSPRTEDYALLDNFKNSDSYKDSPLPPIFHHFEKLLGRTWKRENVTIKEVILVSEISNPKTIFKRNLKKQISDYLSASYTIKTYHIPENPSNIYVKIQLANTSDKHPSNQFSNAKELLNRKCIFQAEIKVQVKALKQRSLLCPVFFK